MVTFVNLILKKMMMTMMSAEHFTYMATRQLSRDATVNDLADI